MCIRGYPRLTCYKKLSLESLNSIPVLYLWWAECLFLYLGFKVNDQQSHFREYTPRKPDLEETRAPQCSSQHCLS